MPPPLSISSLRTSYMSTVLMSFLLLPLQIQLLLCPSSLLTSGSLLYYSYTAHTHTHTYTHMGMHTHGLPLLSLFSDAHMHMCLGLTPWHWVTYHWSHPWRQLGLHLSEVSHSWPIVLCLGWGQLRFSSFSLACPQLLSLCVSSGHHHL